MSIQKTTKGEILMKKIYIIKNFIYLFEIILIFVFQHNPLFSLQILGVKSILLIPAFVSMCMFMNKKEAIIYAILTGAFLDMELSNVFGLHIVLLFLCGYTIFYLSENFINVNMINTVIMSFVVTLIIVSVRFLLFYVLKGYPDVLYALENHYLPSILHTVIITPIMYLFNRSIFYFTHEKGGI